MALLFGIFGSCWFQFWQVMKSSFVESIEIIYQNHYQSKDPGFTYPQSGLHLPLEHPPSLMNGERNLKFTATFIALYVVRANAINHLLAI